MCAYLMRFMSLRSFSFCFGLQQSNQFKMKPFTKMTGFGNTGRAEQLKDESSNRQNFSSHLQLLEKKLNLLMSYESKIKSLEQRMDSTFSDTQTFEASWLEQHLKSSVVFQQSLSKLQANVINSFGKLQHNLHNTIQQLNIKVSTMEDSFLDLFRAQEKQMTRLSNNQGSLSQSIKVLQQLSVGLSSRSTSNEPLQALLNLKIQKHINESTSKLHIIETELHKLETRMRSQIQTTSNDVQKRTLAIQEKMTQMKKQFGQVQTEVKELNLNISHINTKLKSTDAFIKSLQAELRNFDSLSMDLKNNGKTIQLLTRQMGQTQAKMVQFEKVISNSGTISATSRSNENSQSKQSLQNKPTSSVLKPQKKDVFISDEFTPATKDAPPQVNMQQDFGVGIKGLRKSKQKQPKQPTSLSPNLPTNRNKLEPSSLSKPVGNIFNPPRPKRDLPPVHQPLKPPSKQSGRGVQPQIRHQSEQEEEFFVQEDGYIVDKHGQYILDKWGQPLVYTSEFEEDD